MTQRRVARLVSAALPVTALRSVILLRMAASCGTAMIPPGRCSQCHWPSGQPSSVRSAGGSSADRDTSTAAPGRLPPSGGLPLSRRACQALPPGSPGVAVVEGAGRRSVHRGRCSRFERLEGRSVHRGVHEGRPKRSPLVRNSSADPQRSPHPQLCNCSSEGCEAIVRGRRTVLSGSW